MTKMKLIDFVIAAIPIGLTPVIIFALAEGWLDFGGGEKDILLALPYLIWALVFFLVAVIFIIKRSTRRRWIAKSALIASITLVIVGVAAYFTSWLGIA
jgi:Kef-type K+ transport system membrane component KefB